VITADPENTFRLFFLNEIWNDRKMYGEPVMDKQEIENHLFATKIGGG